MNCKMDWNFFMKIIIIMIIIAIIIHIINKIIIILLLVIFEQRKCELKQKTRDKKKTKRSKKPKLDSSILCVTFFFLVRSSQRVFYYNFPLFSFFSFHISLNSFFVDEKILCYFSFISTHSYWIYDDL